MKWNTLTTLLAALLLAGCAVVPTAQAPDRLLPPVDPAPAPASAAPTEPTEAATTADREPVYLLGTDQLVRLPEKRPSIRISGEDVALNFERAPLTEVVHTILGDLLNLNYSLDQPLTGEITLHTRAPIPRQQLLPILETVLQTNGAMMVRGEDGLYHLGKADAMRPMAGAPRRLDDLPAGYGLVIVPLTHISAQSMADILKPVARPDAFVRIDPFRNMLILAGSRNQIDGWMEMVNSFDIDLMAGMSVGIFPLEHATVNEIYVALGALLSHGLAVTAEEQRKRQAQGEAGTPLTADLALPTPMSSLQILPIERLNSLLVIAPRARQLEQVRDWIERLDRQPENALEPQLFVYAVQNGTATHLAGLLGALFSGGGIGNTPAPGAAGSGVAPGLGEASLGGGVSQAMREAGATAGQQTFSQSTIGDNIRVVADEHNNALLIFAPRREYQKIEAALRKLDVAPTQVLIEASIIEVTLTDQLRYGLEWYFNNSIHGDWRGDGLLNLRTSGDIGPSQPGFSYSISNPVGELRAVLNALAEKSLLNVISNPSILVLDNHTAAIHVGDQQPIRSAETITDGGRTTTSIQYKDTGVMLSVTPSVNAGGMVSMIVRQEVTDVGSVDQATGQRAFLRREISTRVAVRSGETVVLGGLIRDNNSRGKQGVPFLHDLPVVGNLFGSTSTSSNRTELLVMIVPRVIRNEQDIREVSAEMRERMQGLKLN
jgi:general secretion pathway protein D